MQLVTVTLGLQHRTAPPSPSRVPLLGIEAVVTRSNPKIEGSRPGSLHAGCREDDGTMPHCCLVVSWAGLRSTLQHVMHADRRSVVHDPLSCASIWRRVTITAEQYLEPMLRCAPLLTPTPR